MNDDRRLERDDLARVLLLLAAFEEAACNGSPVHVALDDLREPDHAPADDDDVARELHRARVVLEALLLNVGAVEVLVPLERDTVPGRICSAPGCPERVALWWCPAHELERAGGERA